ncbi:MAG TPA: hypothetical protein VE153_25490 [Myxococcus sp.]|nr:hypothetical protein [Myxococcus sp.]
MNPGRYRQWMGGCALAVSAALVGGCAMGRSEARDDNAERIERILSPVPSSEPIPDGIVFIPDGPSPDGPSESEPFARVDAPAPSDRRQVAPCTRPPHGAILPAPVPLACLLSPGRVEYRIAPSPGGSIPGLLP